MELSYKNKRVIISRSCEPLISCASFKLISSILFFLSIFIFPCASSAVNKHKPKHMSASNYSVCFTPAQHCAKRITSLMRKARHSIFMQAYAFTSRPIAKALVAAQKRGVKVSLLIDVGQLQKESHSRLGFLVHNHIPLLIDDKVNIAHNKVIIVDGSIVETGSFNYTYSAEHFNAENVLIIHDANLAQAYLHNWQSRKLLSRMLSHREISSLAK